MPVLVRGMDVEHGAPLREQLRRRLPPATYVDWEAQDVLPRDRSGDRALEELDVVLHVRTSPDAVAGIHRQDGALHLSRRLRPPSWDVPGGVVGLELHAGELSLSIEREDWARDPLETARDELSWAFGDASQRERARRVLDAEHAELLGTLDGDELRWTVVLAGGRWVAVASLRRRGLTVCARGAGAPPERLDLFPVDLR